MSRFEIFHEERDVFDPTADNSVKMLDTETGAYTVIDPYGASIRALAFNYDGVVRKVIFGDDDLADYKAGIARPDSTTFEEYDPTKGIPEMLEHPTWANAATIDLASRVHEGKISITDPKTGKVVREVDIGTNHPPSNSHLHGNAPKTYFPPIDPRADDSCAQVSFMIPVGVGTPYEGGIVAHANLMFVPGGLLDSTQFTTASGDPLPYAYGRHASFLIQGGDLSQHQLYMSPEPTGVLAADQKTMNPDGSVITPARRFDDGVIEKLSGRRIEETLVLDPRRRRGQMAVLRNTANGCGLAYAIHDANTPLMTLWNNHNLLGEDKGEMHLSMQGLGGGHGASLSLPGEVEYESIAQALRQRHIHSGQPTSIDRSYRALQPKG